MKFFLPLIVSLLFLGSCSSPSKENDERLIVPIVDFEGIRPLLEKQNDTTYIVNFWATWCAPCVKEIPYFERIAEEFSDKKIAVILVNLDFSTHYESRLIPFIKDNNIRSKVIMLDDPNSNYWINEVSPQWSGAIPATIIYNKHKTKFFEKEFTLDELRSTVNDFLN